MQVKMQPDKARADERRLHWVHVCPPPPTP